jgi:hypothetical protein
MQGRGSDTTARSGKDSKNIILNGQWYSGRYMTGSWLAARTAATLLSISASVAFQRRAQHAAAVTASRLRWVVVPANRMNRDEFYTAMAPNDDARLRKILWTIYWRGNAQLRERIEDELRPAEQPKVKQKKELPEPGTVLDEVTTFVTLAKDGAYMAGDRRVHHTERSKWRLTFRRLAGDALAALQADNPGPAQQAVTEIVDLACDMKSYDYFHSDDPVEAAKFVVSDAVAALWESVLRHDGFAAFAQRVPEQLIRWEADYGWTRRGYGQVPEKETALCVPLARLLATPDMWRRFAESYLEALDAAGRADPGRPRAVYGSFDETRYRRDERTKDLAAWHGMLLDRFAGAPEDELLDRLAVSPALAGPELTFLRARIAERRGDVTQAAAPVTECLQELPAHTRPAAPAPRPC